MSILDGILGQMGGNVLVAQIAQKVGISPTIAESAVAALGKAHSEPGDTIEQASASTGLDPDVLNKITSHLGGEGVLGQIGALLQDHPQFASGLEGTLDRDGDGNPINDLAGFASGLLGKN